MMGFGYDLHFHSLKGEMEIPLKGKRKCKFLSPLPGGLAGMGKGRSRACLSLAPASFELHCDHSLFYCKFYLSRFTQVMGDRSGQVSFVYNNYVSLCIVLCSSLLANATVGGQSCPHPSPAHSPVPSLPHSQCCQWLSMTQRLTQAMTMLCSSSLPD